MFARLFPSTNTLDSKPNVELVRFSLHIVMVNEGHICRDFALSYFQWMDREGGHPKFVDRSRPKASVAYMMKSSYWLI